MYGNQNSDLFSDQKLMLVGSKKVGAFPIY